MTLTRKLLVILWIATSFATLAEPRTTHRSLAELFFPPSSATLVEQSWPAAQAAIAPEAWRILEPVAKLPRRQRERAFARLAHNQQTATIHLLVRRFYLGWFYSGERGRQFANVPPRNWANSPPSKPDLAPAPLLNKEQTLTWKDGEIDYLIVGSGPAGSVLGYELSRAGYRTVLVERGSFVLPDTVDTREVPQLKVGGGAVPTLDRGILVRNGNAVGGGSTVNVDLGFAPTLPFVQAKIEGWRRRQQIGPNQWSKEDVARAYAWVREKVGTRLPGLEELNGNNAVLWDGARALGLDPQLYELNTDPGLPEHLNKRSAVKTLLLEAASFSENPLVIISDLSVRRLLHDGPYALGVVAKKTQAWQHASVLPDPSGLNLQTGQTYRLLARNVILCAGAEGSAAILMRSELGGPQVGRGVVLHPSLPLIGLFDRKIEALKGTASTVYVEDDEDQEGLLYECMTGGPEYVAMMLFGSGAEVAARVRKYNFLSGFGVLLVDSVVDSNRLQLDAQGEPRVDYRLTARDKSRLRKGLARAVHMMLEAGAKEVYLPSSELSPRDGRLQAFRSYQDLAEIEKIQFLPGQTVVTSAHMQATCKMGTVVDWDHRLKGFHNLYVCDSSVFPGSVGANPMQSIYTVAKLFSEELTRRQ